MPKGLWPERPCNSAHTPDAEVSSLCGVAALADQEIAKLIVVVHDVVHPPLFQEPGHVAFEQGAPASQFLILGVKSIGLESGSFAADGARRIPLGAGNADAGRAACVFRDARQQLGLESGPTAPAGRLLLAGGALHFHGALVGLLAQRAQQGING